MSEKIIDDLNLDTLQLLKDKMSKQQKQEEPQMPIKIVQERKRSLKFGVLGTGQAGSRLAECFYKHGYSTIVMNTAPQDLEHINVPDDNKLLFKYGLGGAAKELEIGKEAAEMHRNHINLLVHDKLANVDVYIVCVSLGGGSGAGSVSTIIDVLSSIGHPIVVISVLPMENDDAQTKHNSLQTLSNLSKLVQEKKIQSMVVVDNAKIEAIYSDVSQLRFFDVANQAIVDPINTFNELSSQPSPYKALDSTEWAKLLIDGEGLMVFGSLTVSNYQDETAIAEAVITNLDSNLLAGGFDLKQSKYVGFIVAANEEVLEKLAAKNINYAAAIVQEQAGTPKSMFRGVYITDDPEDHVRVYSCFAGLSLPMSRVESLKKEALELTAQAKSKDEVRNLNLSLDTGTDKVISAAQKVREQVAAKNSAFGKLMGNVINKRK
jgi:cell division GTPase FtsZ